MVAENTTDHFISILLYAILQRYPEYSETIARLFKEDDSFRSLCNDYRLCLNAFNYWNEMNSEKAQARQVEYDDLLRELEEEVLIYLENVK